MTIIIKYIFNNGEDEMNITQYTTLKDAITTYVDTIIDAVEPHQALKLLEILIDAKAVQQSIEQRFEDIIGQKNQTYNNLLSLRRVYMGETNLNLASLGESIQLEELQMEYRAIIKIFLKNIRTDIKTNEELTKLALQQNNVIKSYVKHKFDINEEFMKLDLMKELASTNHKVEQLETKVEKIVGVLREHVKPFIDDTNEKLEALDQKVEALDQKQEAMSQKLETVSQNQKDMKQQLDEHRQVFDKILNSLDQIASRLDRIENNQNQEEQKSSSSTPTLFK